MSAVSILRRRTSLAEQPAEPVDWANIAAGTALVAGGLLMLGRRRRTGMAVAAAGTALAMLQHQDTVRAWWFQVPSFIEHVEGFLGQVQDKVGELRAHREAFADAVAEAVESPDLQRKED
jgi:hypothetical protein